MYSQELNLSLYNLVLSYCDPIKLIIIYEVNLPLYLFLI